jgi:hypothetical protein
MSNEEAGGLIEQNGGALAGTRVLELPAAARIGELLDHHRTRLDDVHAAVAAGASSRFSRRSRTWTGCWCGIGRPSRS